MAPTLEGSRPLLVEVQALVSPTGYGTPTRKASGLDPNRLSLLIAVLGRRAGIALGSQDVYANLAGGLSVAEPALDLPLALALASSTPRPADPAGDGRNRRDRSARRAARRSIGLERRLREAARLGFERAIVPAGAVGTARSPIDGIDVVAGRERSRDAIEHALGRRPRSSWRGRSRRC